MAVIQNIKNKLGTIVYPKTLTKAVYEEDGTRLDNEISAITSDISSLNDTISKKKIYRKLVATAWDGSGNRSLGLSVDEYTILSIAGGATYQVPFFSGNGWYAHNFNSITSGTGFETYVAYIKNSDINIVS